jgi:nucleoside-diphosphate-sugar epimerase
VLVTGGTGFVGSHTVEQLLQRGFTVRCLVRYSRPDLGWIGKLPVEIVRGSYYSIDTLQPALADVDYVMHIAGVTKAKKDRDYHDGNVLATKNLLEAATGFPALKKFTFVSSLAAAGPGPDGIPLREDAHSVPITTYGISKLEAETVCHLYANKLPITILRPPAVYGPRDTDILQMFRYVKRGIRPVFGLHKRVSVVYGPELARAIIEATISQRTDGETYFVSDPNIYELDEILLRVAKLLGRRTVAVRFPPFVLYTIAAVGELASTFSSSAAVLNIEKARDLLQPNWLCDPSKLKNHAGFETQVSLEDGLRITIEWYKEYGWL